MSGEFLPWRLSTHSWDLGTFRLALIRHRHAGGETTLLPWKAVVPSKSYHRGLLGYLPWTSPGVVRKELPKERLRQADASRNDNGLYLETKACPLFAWPNDSELRQDDFILEGAVAEGYPV
jgi:hypothetical protein